MGMKARAKPRRLPQKLRQIRIRLGLSQSQLMRHLKLTGTAYTRISKFESGSSEPTLLDLLRYARAAGVCVDVLIDDRLNLPKTLPGVPMHSGMDLPTSKR
jgi:transcriptional regulator with XRE-family HTH domain